MLICNTVYNCNPNTIVNKTYCNCNGVSITTPCSCNTQNITCSGKETTAVTDKDYISIYKLRIGNTGDYILADDINNLRKFINDQEEYRNARSWWYGSISKTSFGTDISQGNIITSTDFNNIKNAILTLSSKISVKSGETTAKVTLPNKYNKGDIIYASDYNLLVTSMSNISKTCACNTFNDCGCVSFKPSYTTACSSNCEGKSSRNECDPYTYCSGTTCVSVENKEDPKPVDPPTNPDPPKTVKKGDFSVSASGDFFMGGGNDTSLRHNKNDIVAANLTVDKFTSTNNALTMNTFSTKEIELTNVSAVVSFTVYTCQYYGTRCWDQGALSRTIRAMDNQMKNPDSRAGSKKYQNGWGNRKDVNIEIRLAGGTHIYCINHIFSEMCENKYQEGHNTKNFAFTAYHNKSGNNKDTPLFSNDRKGYGAEPNGVGQYVNYPEWLTLEKPYKPTETRYKVEEERGRNYLRAMRILNPSLSTSLAIGTGGTDDECYHLHFLDLGSKLTSKPSNTNNGRPVFTVHYPSLYYYYEFLGYKNGGTPANLKIGEDTIWRMNYYDILLRYSVSLTGNYKYTV